MPTCIIDSDNHSDDLIHVKSGAAYSIPVCGYHERVYRNTQTIYAKARRVAEAESQWIVWTENRDNSFSVDIKTTQLAAKRAYNKLQITGDITAYGYARVNDAEARVRREAGFDPFPKILVPIS